MKKQKWNKVLQTICFLAISPAFLFAQYRNFKYSATLPQIDSSGFYKINLEPSIVCKSNDDLSDLRIWGSRGSFIPYINAVNLPQPEKSFRIFPRVTADLRPDTETTYVAENKYRELTGTLWVKFRNTDVERQISLQGSDDLNKWYAIDENIKLEPSHSANENSSVQMISFAPSNFRFFKISVDDSHKYPVEILSVGEYLSTSAPQFYWQVPIRSFSKKDSAAFTQIDVRLKESYLLNTLRIFVMEPRFYNRETTVYSIDKNHRETVFADNLNSDKNGRILFNLRTSHLILKIANGDNPPLTIDSVNIGQENQYIVAYLEKGKNYKLLTGDSLAKTPAYDLNFFTDSIHTLREITPGKLIKNASFISVSASPLHLTLLIWIAIAVALVILSLLTWKMIKEIGKKDHAES